jgi:hypothetical protein
MWYPTNAASITVLPASRDKETLMQKWLPPTRMAWIHEARLERSLGAPLVRRVVAGTLVREAGSRTARRNVGEGDRRYAVPSRYDDEGSERSAIGSASVSVDAWWRATLTVPLPAQDAVFVRIERRGPLPDGYRGAEESGGFSLPIGELDAVMTALTGVIAQARRDGVLT